MDRFKKLGKIGQGAHGTVIKCERKKVVLSTISFQNELENSKKEIVAIKKMKFSYLSNEQGLASQVIRELMYVQELRHENIVRLYEVFPHHKSLNLVFEYVPFNLEEIIHRERFSFSDANVKSFCKMLLSAIAHCHSKWVLHRDIKPSNCLVSCSGVLKVADFGLAKQFGNLEQALSPEACTLWYRAPELLFGSRLYGEAMDLWAVGCVFGEMLSRKVLFPGDRTVISQLSAIFAIRGSPDEGKWPGVTTLPNYFEFEKTAEVDLRTIFPLVGEEALDLLNKMLCLDPNRRITAEDALKHEYFERNPKEQKMKFGEKDEI